MKENYPYVYRGTHRITQEVYIGARSANKIAPIFDLGKYRTSSKYVKPIFDEFDWEIIFYGFDKEIVFEVEQNMIEEIIGDEKCLNRHCKGKFNMNNKTHSEETKAKMSKSSKGKNAGKIPSKETLLKRSNSLKGKKRTEEQKERYRIGSIGKNKGLKQSKETIEKRKNTMKNVIKKPFSEQARKNISISQMGKKLSDEHKLKISLGVNRNKKPISEETRVKLSKPRKKQPIGKCPHCDKEGGLYTLKRWHFDNCKFKK